MRQAAGQQFRAVAQRQHDEGECRRKIECGRGQEGDAQHAHGAPSQFVGRRGERTRLGLRLAVQHDGGDTPHPIEEARLQPRQRQELAARRRRRAQAGGGHRDRDQQPAQHQHERGQRIGRQSGERHQQRTDDRQCRGRQPAGVQAIQRLDAIHHGRGQLAGVLGAKPRRAGMQQARQRIGPQPPPCRRSRVEGGAFGGDRQRRAQTARAAQSPPTAETCRRTWPVSAPASSIAAHQAWPTPVAVPSTPNNTTGLAARLPARRSPRSQARDVVLIWPDCILPPA